MPTPPRKNAHQDIATASYILVALRRQFDVRLSALVTSYAGSQLRDTLRRGAKLAGKLKAGVGHADQGVE